MNPLRFECDPADTRINQDLRIRTPYRFWLSLGADPRFWFRGHWKGLWWTEIPQRGPEAEPPEARRMLRHEAEKTTYEEKKTSPYRLTLYDNIIIIIISFFCFQLFLF